MATCQRSQRSLIQVLFYLVPTICFEQKQEEKKFIIIPQVLLFYTSGITMMGCKFYSPLNNVVVLNWSWASYIYSFVVSIGHKTVLHDMSHLKTKGLWVWNKCTFKWSWTYDQRCGTPYLQGFQRYFVIRHNY